MEEVKFYNPHPAGRLYTAYASTRSVDCPVCGKLVARNTGGIGGHFRKHIKKGEATTEDYFEFLKKIGLWVSNK